MLFRSYYGGATKDTYIPPTTAELYNIPDPGTHFFPATSAAQVNAALEDVTNSTLSCVFEVDWDSVPERDPVLDVPVYKACDKVNIYGVPVAADAEKIAVNFAVDCASEGEEFGWNWADLPNATWKQVKAVGDDVTRCRQVRLCPKACDQLKIKGGKKIWDTATAKFGCNPIVID